MTAIISPCGQYRYTLERVLSTSGKRVAIGMVNPSTATGDIDDATIRKLIGFGKRLDWASFTVFNKFAYRATDVNELKHQREPVGPMNDAHMLNAMLFSDQIIVAWGSLNKLPLPLRSRWRRVVKMAQLLNKPLYCFGTCNDGHPKHPVMIGYDSTVQLWEHDKCT